MGPMYQVIASDLDGTLLNAEHQADPITSATLRELEARGVHLIIATGRHYCDVRGIREAIGIDAHLITSNGARVHAPDNTLIHSENIPADLVRALVQPEFSAGTLTNLYLDEDWLISEPCDWLLDMH